MIPPEIQAILDEPLPFHVRNQKLRVAAEKLGVELTWNTDIHSKEYGQVIEAVPVATARGGKRFG